MATKKKSANSKAVKAAIVKAPPKPRVRRSFEERTIAAQAKFDKAVEKGTALAAKLQEREQKAQARTEAVTRALDALIAAGPKLPKGKDKVALEFARAEKKREKLLAQLKREEETMDRIRAEHGDTHPAATD